jgi:hypothetical protein
MKAEEIASIAIPVGNFDQQHPHRTNQESKSTSTVKTAKVDSKIIKTPSQVRIQLNKLEATISRSQQVVQHIRQVNQSMETIDSYLSEMRTKLERIVKIYPPYPPGSTERIEALRQFSALRKMIDQMTRSVGDDNMTNILSDTDGSADAAGLEAQSVESKRSIDRQPLYLGQNGLDIPDISVNASDEKISGALKKTIAAQITLQARHRSFIADANRIISQLS